MIEWKREKEEKRGENRIRRRKEEIREKEGKKGDGR
jgi:hypothetical protein